MGEVNIILEYLAHIIDYIGIVIVLWGFTHSLGALLLSVVRRESFYDFTTRIRCRLGTYILLGLEFMIASDIIMTAIKPTTEELILVGSLVAIRTAIGYFLAKELESVKHG